MPRTKSIFAKRKSPAKPDSRTELIELRALVELKENEIKDLKAKYEEMKDYKDKYEDLIKKRLKQFEDHEGLQSKYKTTQGKLDIWKTKNEDLKKKIEVLKTELNGKKAKNQSLPSDEPSFRHFFYELSKYEVLVSKVLTLLYE